MNSIINIPQYGLFTYFGLPKDTRTSDTSDFACAAFNVKNVV